VGGQRPLGYLGILPAQPELPIGEANPNPDPLTVNVHIAHDSSPKKFWGGVANPKIDAKWEEDAILVINADIDGLAPVAVGTIEDFSDPNGDRFPLTLGPGRSFIL
jgi:hypothetical protein